MKNNNFVTRELSRKRFEQNLSSRSDERDKLSVTKDFIKSSPNSLYRVKDFQSYYTPQNIIKNRIR